MVHGKLVKKFFVGLFENCDKVMRILFYSMYKDTEKLQFHIKNSRGYVQMKKMLELQS